MTDGPKPPSGGKPLPRPRRSAPDLRVLSAKIVETAEAEPAPPAATEPEPVAADPVGTAPRQADRDDVDVLLPPRRRAPVVLIAGGVALVVIVIALAVGLSLRGRGSSTKRIASSAAQPATTTTPPATAKTADPEPAELEIEPEPEPEPTAAQAAKPAAEPAPKPAAEPAPKPAAEPRPAPKPAAEPAEHRTSDEPEREPTKSTSRASDRDDPKRLAEAELAYRNGVQLAAVGDNDGAVKSLRSAASGNPAHAPTWRALGDVYAKRGDRGQARSAYQRYLRLAPDGKDAAKVRERLDAL